MSFQLIKRMILNPFLSKTSLNSLKKQMLVHTLVKVKDSSHPSVAAVILKSNLSDKEKEIMLDDQIQKERDLVLKEKDFILKEKDFEIEKVRLQKDLEIKDGKIKLLTYKFTNADLHKKNYEQLLNVIAIIENYETMFEREWMLSEETQSRVETWRKYLSSSEERMKPFKDGGFAVEDVCWMIDAIYNSHSHTIHSTKIVGGVNTISGLLSPTEVDLLRIVVEILQWSDGVAIE